MRRKVSFVAVLLLALPLLAVGVSAATQALLEELAVNAAEPFSAEAGSATWFKDANGRSCTSCHTDSVHAQGRHERTGKVIEPMAPSVNPERLTKRKKINKWFLRNCKWTFGRECTAQEKGDILVWLSQQ
jgi:hypothetical protein